MKSGIQVGLLAQWDKILSRRSTLGSTTRNLLSGCAAGLLFASLAFGQTVPNNWVTTLRTGFNTPQSLIGAVGYLWTATLFDVPGQLARIDPNTQAATYLTFANDGFHTGASDTIYIASKGKIYVCFKNTGRAVISEVDPTTMAYTDVVNDVTAPSQTAFPSIAADSTYLYFTAGFAGQLIRYRLSDWTNQGSVNLDNGVIFLQQPHSVRITGTTAFVTGSNGNSAMIRVDLGSFTVTGAVTVPGNGMTDDMAVDAPTYAYVCAESPGVVYRVNKTTMAVSAALYASPTSQSCFATYYDGVASVWAVFGGSPGSVMRLDPTSLATSTFGFPSGQNDPNEIWSNGSDTIYFTYFTSPEKVSSSPLSMIPPTTPCTTDANGICITGLSAIQNNLLGPLTPYGSNPWIFGDLAEKGTADNMAPIALTASPALGTALPGTVSHTQGTQTITTTADLTGPLAGKIWVAIAWTSVDGAATGRALCPIQSVSSTTITCSENMNEPDFSGVTAYLLPAPNSYGCDFTCWTTENPPTVWNYYDVAIALYRLWIRTGNSTYLTQARAYTDIQWQWTLDHGYRRVSPRASAMISQFFRVGEGHTERLPGLYNWIALQIPLWANASASPAIDNREAGYMLWDIALGAKVDTNPTRHAQYCSWLTTYTTQWNSIQAPDGSFPEEEYAINPGFVAAPKAFAAPFLYPGAPWREAINVKAMEASYESLSDNGAQGCSNPSLAATTLTTITKAVTWQNNYGRDTSNRGIYYEVNSQSNDQLSVSPATGTVSISLGSTAVTGVGTSFMSTCMTNPFIGFQSAGKVYKFFNCSDNTHATLTTPFGLYGEGSNVSGSAYGIAPIASTTCHSSATQCNNGIGDRNLTRTTCGGMGWLYSVTLNTTYKTWTDECLSAQLGGPTAGLTSAANEGMNTLPCSGPGCDGLVPDTFEAAANCGTTTPINTPPCLYGNLGADNITILGKNYGEAFGAPGIDNALAWRLLSGPPPPVPPIITSTSPLPGGTVGTFYSYQFTASGTTPISWAAGVGKPAWATLSSSGALQGTPNISGVSSIPITVTNSAGSDGPHNFSLTIVNSGVAPTITSTNPLPPGTIGVAYSFQFAAGGTAPITWTATGLPAWATLSSSGLFTGTPNAIGVSTMLVTATNTYGAPSKTFNLTISGVAPTITSTSPLPGGTNGTAYSFQFTATGTSPITWGATGLPAWASFSVGGLLTGTPNISTTTTIAVTATNSTGTSGPHNFNLTVVTAPIAPTITTTSPLPNGTLGSAYSFQFSANGSAPITWSGTGLPGWASLSSAGLLTGTPNVLAVSTLHITATNGTGSDGPHDFTLTVPGVAPTVTSATPLPGGTIGIAYSFQFSATGTTPITWSATGLPGWASLSSGGLLTGTPNAVAVTSFPVTATNATGSGGKTFSLTTINPATPPTITSTSPLPIGAAGIPYTYQFTANGTNPITWSGTSLPAWATLSTGGFFSGTPTGGTSTMNITATNTTGSAGPSPFSITISAAPPRPTCSPRTGLTPPNVLDSQYQTNMALGVISCTNNISESGSCNATDVQRVINAILGGACVVGP